jgi:hypothetical protein
MTQLVDYRHPDTRTRETPICIRAMPGGAVEVDVQYTRAMQRGAKANVAAGVVLFVAVPLAVQWWLHEPWCTALAVALMVGPAIVAVSRLPDYFGEHRLVASAEGLWIERTGRYPRRLVLPRAAIRDVRIRFPRERAGAGCTVTIHRDRWWRRPVRILRGLGGDHAARVADALRAGLHMPPVSWPSGKPSKPTHVPCG